MTQDKTLLAARKQAILDKISYLRSIIYPGIDSVEIFIRNQDGSSTAYISRHDLPFNLNLEVSILLHDAIDHYTDMIAEIDFYLTIDNE